MRRLTRLFLDAVAGNTDALPRRLADLGVRYPRAQEEELRAEIDTLWFRYADTSLADIDPNELVREVLGLINRQRLVLPSRFLLLDRALLTLGSVGQELCPDFNVFQVARPYARALATEQLSPTALFTRARGEVASSTQAMLDLPRDAAEAMERLLRNEVEIGARLEGFDEPLRRLDATANRLVLALVLTGLVIGSSQLAGVQGGPHVLGIHIAAFGGFLSSAVVGLVLALAVARRGRL
jgi:ubiquinone biosynthesis protein